MELSRYSTENLISGSYFWPNPYLTATGINIGLIMNFGAVRLQFKRKTRIFQPSLPRQTAQDDPDQIHDAC